MENIHNDDYQTLGMRYCITHDGIDLLIKSLESLKKCLSEIALQEGEKVIVELPRTPPKGF